MIRTPEAEAGGLREQIRRHDRLYYQEQSPEIGDAEYDTLMRRLRELEERSPECRDPGSPTMRVSGEPVDSFHQVRHPAPMLSLANAFSYEDFLAWSKRTRASAGRTPETDAELKIDGLAFRGGLPGREADAGRDQGRREHRGGRDPHGEDGQEPAAGPVRRVPGHP